MKNRWSEAEATAFVTRFGAEWGEDLALRAYSSRLLGVEGALVLHGGGNTSVKAGFVNVLGKPARALYVKASGADLSSIEPGDNAVLDLAYLERLRALGELSDEAMLDELRAHRLRAGEAPPSVEALVHAFLPPRFIDHTHADAVLALTNQRGGEATAREALGEGVIVLGYVRPGFRLAKAAAEAFQAQPEARAMVWAKHGLVTWGATARESDDRTIDFVTRAERYLSDRAAGARGSHASRGGVANEARTAGGSLEAARGRLAEAGPIVRGRLARSLEAGDAPGSRLVLRALADPDILDLLASERGKEITLTPPLTTDHLVRTKSLPLWIDSPAHGDRARLREQVDRAITDYAAAYEAYVARHEGRLPPGLSRLDSLPRVVLLPGLGVLCAGRDAAEADVVRDIALHTLRVKAQIAGTGDYEGLGEEQLFDMEYHVFQHSKIARTSRPALEGHTALVTGAAGAIGSGISRELLENGCHVAVTDLAGETLDRVVGELQGAFGPRVLGAALDVTDRGSIGRGFAEIVSAWGGLDLLVVNAGIGLASSLAEMDLEAFRRLERVNVEGTLLLLAEAARHFEHQGSGGDIVLVSSKNVFSPGASFGAYSATKAAAHQLARIASLELAMLDVRVNMVAPDAIFSEGGRRSGLWEEVGPARMRAHGLDEKGLEEYYRSRNLLKAKITARDVGRAVLFFATRQTPTTGATLPVDGGLPDATPR